MRPVVTRLLPCAAMLAALHGAAHAAGGAYVVDDVNVDEPGACKIESWLAFAGNRDFAAVTTPTCIVSLIRPTELTVQAARFRADGVWGTALAPKFKTNIVPAAVGTFGLALEGGAVFDLTTGVHATSFLFVPVTYSLSDSFRINVNAGWQHDAVHRHHFASYGLGFEWNFVKPLTLIGEVFGLAGRHDGPRPVTQPRFQVGLRYTPVDTADIDLIFGRNVAGENANWVTLGLNLRFPPGK